MTRPSKLEQVRERREWTCPRTKKPCDMVMCKLVECAIVAGEHNRTALGLRRVFKNAGVPFNAQPAAKVKKGAKG
jgi:hypothetical protein